MKVNKTMLMPLVIGLFVSACSTSSREETTAIVEVPSNLDTVTLQPPMVNVSSVEAKPMIESVADFPNTYANAYSNSDAERNRKIEENLNSRLVAKAAEIARINSLLSNNRNQLLALGIELDQKDALIADLQGNMTSLEALVELERQKSLRESLESRHALIQLENDSLRLRVNQLTNENSMLQQQLSELETISASKGALESQYQTLLGEHTELQRQNTSLNAEIDFTQQTLSQLRSENLVLGGALSEARAQHQILWDKIRALNEQASQLSHQESDISPLNLIDSETTKDKDISEMVAYTESIPIPMPVVVPMQNEQILRDLENENQRIRGQLVQFQNAIEFQKRLIDDYKNDVLKLEAALDEGADYAARWKAIDIKLAQAQQSNSLLQAKLSESEDSLMAYKTALEEVNSQLAQTQKALELNENNSIALLAAVDLLLAQLSSVLTDVQWQLPNEMAINNTFEILVTARVQPSLRGGVFQAVLVTDSDIQLVSDPVVTAIVQDDRLQWRWRVSGLNEKPDAQLNLFVNQQINFQDQTIQRQVFRGGENLSLINTNLFEKYGFWLGAIFLGLVGGYLIGRVNRRSNTSSR